MNPAIQKANQSVTDFFIAGLKDGSSPILQRWDTSHIPPLSFNPVSGVRYRGGNQWALFAAEKEMDRHDLNPSGDRRWVTYKQALSIGAQVRKGAKSQLLITVKEFEDRRRDEQGGQAEETDLRSRPRMAVMPFFVFHATQIDGLPPMKVIEPRPLDERMAQAQAIVDGLGVPILTGASYAAYSPSKDRIMMPDREVFIDDAAFMATLLHETAHATGHHSRLDRKFGSDRSSEAYAREELRAEMASFDMCRRLGVPFDPSQHVSYVNSWIKLLESDPVEIMRAAADSEKILKFLKVPELEIEKIPAIEKEHAKELDQDRGAERPADERAPQTRSRPEARKSRTAERKATRSRELTL